ncbi:lasso peptide biosynthesis PqqD family chaperone [Amycolatopsis aidingensis]|uniref:lasso peptide biosynthesis PqqD family chaperone n=1 Tax=Amycolatopsis aidingensis TaxID=2842453 RepID=UPI001C0AE2B9|nr:lasso peptide biosynthesis PqqD family chaperone [Amycolatopsis aidingensis]
MPIRLNDDVSSVRTDYGMVLLDENTGRYYELSETAACVVDHLDGEHSEDRAVDALTGRFEVTDQRARADVRALVARLESAGLVTT